MCIKAISCCSSVLGAAALLIAGSSSSWAQSGSRAPVRQPARSAVVDGSGSAARGQATDVALSGYCPVCITAGKEWVKGSTAFQAQFDGDTYLFPSGEQKATFLQDPSAFVPALGGDDVVEFSRSGKRAAGRVDLATRYKDRLYLFANAQNRAAFQQSPAAFSAADLALDGECVVCRVNMNQRVAGKPEFTAVHEGIRYQFPGEEQRAMFVAAPEKYVPAASAGTGGSGSRAGSGTRPAPAAPTGGSGSR